MKTNSRSVQLPSSALPSELNLEEALATARPRFEAPADLRDDIMRRVRAAAKQTPCERPDHWLRNLRWLFIPAAAALVVLALISSRGRPGNLPGPESASLRTAAQALPLDGTIPGEVTAAVVGPLQEELRRLDGDLKRTAEYLLASVP
jgi:hypothetical protein